MGARGPLPSSTNRKRDEAKGAGPAEVVLGSAPAKTSAPAISRVKWRKLHVEARAWWSDLLAAPQASQFMRTDWRRLRAVLELVDRYWRALEDGEATSAAAILREVRQQEREFGLTPDARQRMRWVMQDPSKGSANDEPAPRSKPRPVRADPRLTLVDGKGNG